MKKMLLALIVLSLASVSFAGVAITWQVQWGAYDHTETDLTGGSAALLDSYSVTWQLIYAGANNSIDPVDLSDVAGGWTGGDDAVWATRTIAQGGGTAPQDGTIWDNWMLIQTGPLPNYENLAWSTAGYVFQRVFEGAPAELSWYFDSSLLALDTGYTGSPGMPQQFVLGSGSAGFQPDQQIPPSAVPEPATMALLGLGALAMAIRRRS